MEDSDDHRTQVDPGHLEAHAQRDARSALLGGYHLVDWQALSALRLSGLFDTARPDLPARSLSMPGLPSPVHGHHAHPDARHEARLAYLDLRDVPGAHIE
jgi:hypothetical protein